MLFRIIHNFVQRPIIRRLGSWTNTLENHSLNFINGVRTETLDPIYEEELKLEEPATARVLGTIHASGRGDVNAAVDSAHIAQEEWGKLSGSERREILMDAAKILQNREEEIARIEVSDTGKSLWEAKGDVQSVIDSIKYFSGIAPTICGQHFTLSGGSFGYTRREPLGIVAAIGAWNYPIQMAGWKSAPALACGNAVIFKPSQFTPYTAVILGEIYKEAGLPNGLYNVVQGGAQTGNILTSHEEIAKVTFTGSVETGTKVMTSCASGIKHVTLELGGKSPLIMFEDCDINNAVKGAMMANFLSQGQVCSNGTRVFIQRSIFDDVVSRLVEHTKSIKMGDPHAEDTRMGPMINAEHANKVMNMIEQAKTDGAEILCGGEFITMNDPKLKGKFISPCVLRPTDSMEISCEEVFGPVMNVYLFDTEEEVLRRANDTRFGLASGVFTKDLNRAHRVAAKLQAGNCYINNYNVYPTELPFGGYKMSGLGRENGTITVEYFTQLKTVYVENNDVVCPL